MQCLFLSRFMPEMTMISLASSCITIFSSQIYIKKTQAWTFIQKLAPKWKYCHHNTQLSGVSNNTNNAGNLGSPWCLICFSHVNILAISWLVWLGTADCKAIYCHDIAQMSILAHTYTHHNVPYHLKILSANDWLNWHTNLTEINYTTVNKKGAWNYL